MSNGNRIFRPRIVQWNTRSLRRRHAKVSQQLLRRKYDILLLQETYARAGSLDLPSFIAHHSTTQCEPAACQEVQCSAVSHPPGRSRASVYVRARLPHAAVDIEDILSDGVEAVAITVRIEGRDTSAASIYVRHARFKTSWDADIVCRLVNRLHRDAVICGDCNLHHTSWGCATTDRRGCDHLAAIRRAGLLVLNSGKPTFVRQGVLNSAIDLTLL